jgi:hypothetical protein
MHHPLFSMATALTFSSIASIASAGVAGFSPRAEYAMDKRYVCQGDSFNEVFMSVGMGDPNDGAQADITSFCRSWIDIPNETSYVLTTTPTTYVLSVLGGHEKPLTSISTYFPATVTVGRTTDIVYSATSTLTITTTQTEYALPMRKRNHVRRDPLVERAAAAQITERAVLPKRMVLKARQGASSSSKTLDVVALGAALSSACSCKSIPPLTNYETSTAPYYVSANY